ncbi:MAG TPA: hypothetical protein VI386_23520 [Candidatus Sulfotelmatobacter sp.]
MAYKTLVTNPSAFVKQMAEFIQRMTQQRGSFALAMLLPSESGLSDKWNPCRVPSRLCVRQIIS